MMQNQVAFANFSEDVSAEELANFLEETVGVVWRCKIKKTSIPARAFMQFLSVPIANEAKREHLARCCPHAYVHFASPVVAKEGCMLAQKGYLKFRDKALVARMCGQDAWTKRKLRTEDQKPWKLTNVMVEIGTLVSPQDFMVRWKIPLDGITFEVDPLDRRLRFYWSQETFVSVSDGMRAVRCNYKMEFLLRDVKMVRHIECPQGGGRKVPALSLLLQCLAPPWIFYRTADDDVYQSSVFELADDDDPWIRILDCSPNHTIGSCLVYKVGVNARQGTMFREVLEYFGIQRLLQRGYTQSMNVSMRFPDPECGKKFSFFYSVSAGAEVSFDHLFLVNALVHRGILQASNLHQKFFWLLEPTVTSPDVISLALGHMLGYKNPVYDAYKRLELLINSKSCQVRLGKTQTALQGSIVVRRIIITPTRGYCLAPEVELSNRVIRNYSQVADRFLRVSFHDDDLQSMSPSSMTVTVAPIVRELCGNGGMTRTSLYWRIRDILYSGFELCGRKYSFLAFSASQLREGCAWFFASDSGIKPDVIRDWMGEFPMRNVAKVAARMGQCFSSTYPTGVVEPSEVEDLPEIQRNGYTFSDGVGKISQAFANEISKILVPEGTVPSAFQIRYAGYKGVVVQWPGLTNYKLSLRPSMKKFCSGHNILEVVSWTRFLPSHLNRQIVTLLTSLKVNNQVFIDLQDQMVGRLGKLIEDADQALEYLQMSCSGDVHNTAVTMLSAGFHPRSEPHLREMLQSIRCMQFGELLSKAKIFVPEGRWLLGCLDETGILEYGQCFIQVSGPTRSRACDGSGQSKKGSPLKVITGKIIVTKNPCLHPGDIRVLEAVDAPSLHHLVNCLVFPQKGHRPHPDEVSGSDLDGDVYFASWDKNLLPPSGVSYEPMEFATQEAKNLGRPVKMEDIQEFFTKHAVNDSLGVICNAHVVHADYHEEGAMHANCIKLAQLAAMAVDYPKTGKPAIMPSEFRSTEYPDFMQKEDVKTYQSNKILGILFRRIRGMVLKEIEEHKRWTTEDRETHLLSTNIYDPDLEVPGYESYLEDAWATKCFYDQQVRAIMGRYDVRSEGDLVTGTPLSHSRRQADLSDRMRYAFGSLRKEFRSIFEGFADSHAPQVEENKPAENSLKEQAAPRRKADHVSMKPQSTAFLSMKEAWKARMIELRGDRTPGKQKENKRPNGFTQEATSIGAPGKRNGLAEVGPGVDQLNPMDNDKSDHQPTLLAAPGKCNGSIDVGGVLQLSPLDNDTSNPEGNLFPTPEEPNGLTDVGKGVDTLNLVDHDKKNLEAKACAWYHVTYHPTWMQKAREAEDFDLVGQGCLLSFPWIAVDYLATVKARKSNSEAKVILKPVLIGKRTQTFLGESFLDKICQ